MEQDAPLTCFEHPILNELRGCVDTWRALPNPQQWQVTPETARLLQHWRQHPFDGVRPFFCQIEAVEPAIWLTEVAPRLGTTGRWAFAEFRSAHDREAEFKALIESVVFFSIRRRRAAASGGGELLALLSRTNGDPPREGDAPP